MGFEIDAVQFRLPDLLKNHFQEPILSLKSRPQKEQHQKEWLNKMQQNPNMDKPHLLLEEKPQAIYVKHAITPFLTKGYGSHLPPLTSRPI